MATERKGNLTTQAIQRTRNAAPRSVSKSSPPDATETLRIILACLDDMKAEDIVTIDLTGKTAIADVMVVASGRSNRHVGAIADNVKQALHKAGLKDIRTEGQPHCDWVLLDTGDIIVHVFRPEVRAFYNLEKMWTGSRPSEKQVG